MADLDLIRACAEAMGYDAQIFDDIIFQIWNGKAWIAYEPLVNDDQAMALVKRFGLTIGIDHGNKQWNAHRSKGADPMHTFNTDLNRAICECVAKMKEKDAG